MGCMALAVILTLAVISLVISIGINILLYITLRKERQKVDYEDYHMRANVEYSNPEECGVPRFPPIQYNDENPIYGNINPDTAESDEVCYELMNKPHRAEDKPKADAEHFMCYASLDHSAEKKRKKKGGRKQTSDEFLDIDMEQKMPSRTNSTLASRNSIYLNSQQLKDSNGDEAIHEDPAILLSKINASRFSESS
ncbi:T-cell receptor-associated transmembrane adapter 1 isoform X1 [Polypterus senegalus]|uniref:T-cell receptor-associated transmembrane adapter 1 isoform X1 n=2 Tax=Polypterus senegalus TaxID=55291 RepID=UPI001964F039|nr:T-cell receptor-associated transmembrane adapter 1 isoform X1 [Polypterus senegalus]XP_039600882.1 T-cell receptor-associated transmembrane adapter 1 isoform X1 [Polypterus senegalus]